MERELFIGTSGWYYDHWRENFYPEDISKDKFLEYFSEHLDTVEINNSFYHTPSESTFKNWREKTPDDFLFSVKASQYLTHRKRLTGPEESVDFFFDRVDLLKKKLGPILFQLPPTFKKDADRLKNFLKMLPRSKKYLYTFEFRHDSWFTSEIFEILRKRNAALCITDLIGHRSPVEVIADFAYLRLHGPVSAYAGSYSDEALRKWAGYFKEWMSEGKKIFCYFDNDQKAYAVQDALRLKKLMQ